MNNKSSIKNATPLQTNTSTPGLISKISRYLLAVAILSVFAFPENAYEDMGMIHATDAKVTEESQKAIIFHDNNEEVLILGTDLKATRNTGVIRFIPFPSEPTVSLAPNDSFETINTLIGTHGLKFISYSKGGSGSQEAVELRFNEKLGTHDIAVIKVNDVSGFRDWVNNLFKKKGLPLKSEYPDIEKIVDDYVKRGIAWFVFDFVELTEKTKFIEPVEYRFKTKELYYPLKTSNTVGGVGDIDLILITPSTLCDPYEPIPKCFGIRNMKASTSSQIDRAELKAVLPQADAFFGSKRLFIQMIKYWGKYQFENDILAEPAKGVPNALSYWWNVDAPRDKYFKANLGFDFHEMPLAYQKYTAPGNYFSFEVPSEWKRTEFDLIKDHNQFELVIHAPGTQDTNYLTVTAGYFSDQHKTPQRFIYNLLNQRSKIHGEDYDRPKDVSVGGKKAKVLDIKTYRSPLPGMNGKRIEAFKRVVTIPAENGFFMFAFDSPSDVAAKYLPVFNDILNSVTFANTERPSRLDELGMDDYQVYTDFFTAERLPNITLPQFFENALKERSVFGRTLANRKTDAATLNKLEKIFGSGIGLAFPDYRQKNTAEYLVKDRILIDRLVIVSEDDLKKENREGPSEQTKSLIYLSRVGFNKAKDLALFYIENGGAPITGYFVVMEKKNDTWQINSAMLDKLLIP
jgi:hypothetical protein